MFLIANNIRFLTWLTQWSIWKTHTILVFYMNNSLHFLVLVCCCSCCSCFSRLELCCLRRHSEFWYFKEWKLFPVTSDSFGVQGLTYMIHCTSLFLIFQFYPCAARQVKRTKKKWRLKVPPIWDFGHPSFSFTDGTYLLKHFCCLALTLVLS